MKDERSLRPEQEPRLVPSDKIEGTPLYDTEGHVLAVVEDLVIDAVQGDVHYALVLPEGGSELKPIPWDQLRFDSDKQAYVASTSSELLEKGPAVDPGAVTDWTDESWNARVRSYYTNQSED